MIGRDNYRKRVSFKYIHKLLNSYRSYFNFNYSKGQIPLVIKHYDYLTHYLFTKYPVTKVSKPWEMLELGCYYGLFISFINKLGYYSAVGIDIHRKSIEFAQRFSINVKLVDALEVSKFFEPEFFSLIFAINFFHKELRVEKQFTCQRSLNDWILKIMSESHKILKKGGDFFCTTEINLPLDKIAKLGFSLRYYINNPTKKILIFQK